MGAVQTAHRIPGVIWWAGEGRLRTEQDQVRAVWEILAAHDHAFHPSPVRLPRAYGASHLLFRRERTPASFILPSTLRVRGAPPRPTTAPFSHASRKSPRSFARWARTAPRMSQSMDCMTPTLVDPSSSHSPVPTPTQPTGARSRREAAACRLAVLSPTHRCLTWRGPHDNVRGTSIDVRECLYCRTCDAAHSRLHTNTNAAAEALFARRRQRQQGDGHLRPRWDRGKRAGASETTTAKKKKGWKKKK